MWRGRVKGASRGETGREEDGEGTASSSGVRWDGGGVLVRDTQRDGGDDDDDDSDRGSRGRNAGWMEVMRAGAVWKSRGGRESREDWVVFSRDFLRASLSAVKMVWSCGSAVVAGVSLLRAEKKSASVSVGLRSAGEGDSACAWVGRWSRGQFRGRVTLWRLLAAATGVLSRCGEGARERRWSLLCSTFEC
jgi:hypothetical protein